MTTKRQTLTDRAVNAATSDIYDVLVPGFMLRVRDSGVKSYALFTRYPGSPNGTRRTIARVGAISLADARQTARDWLALIKRGKDPAKEQQRERAADLHEMIARKFASLAEQGIEPQGYLYRHYGPNGDLLYVGQSMSAWNRSAQHVRAASWRDQICLIVIEPFATREQSLAAEEEAIRGEYPKHNITHNRIRHPFREIERLKLIASSPTTKEG